MLYVEVLGPFRGKEESLNHQGLDANASMLLVISPLATQGVCSWIGTGIGDHREVSVLVHFRDSSLLHISVGFGRILREEDTERRGSSCES